MYVPYGIATASALPVRSVLTGKPLETEDGDNLLDIDFATALKRCEAMP